MESNLNKSLHGSSGKEKLSLILDYCKEKGYISDYYENVKFGYPEKLDSQFSFQYVLKINEELWIVQSTTSIRKDRMDSPQWNAYNIKRIRNDVTKAFVVYPDNQVGLDKRQADIYSERVRTGIYFSAIDYVLSQSEFLSALESYALQHMVLGKQKAHQGINFEEQIVLTLNNESNLKKWLTGEQHIAGLYYDYFTKIMDFFCLPNVSKISHLEATSNIGKLPSGGSPKTDIVLDIVFKDDSVARVTFSLKKTKNDWVSVHEYDVKKFVEVLELTDTDLITALYKFQEVGGSRSLEEKYKKQLEEKMPYYNFKLAKWVYGGHGGEGIPHLHWATHIISLNVQSGEFKVMGVNDYVDYVCSNVEGQFGTSFRWTYPSGGLGKRIQLKGIV